MSDAADSGMDRAGALADGPRRARELEEEFEFHLEMLARDAEAAGADREAAERAARARFGDPDRYARRCMHIEEGGRVMMRRILIGVNIGVIVALSLGLAVTFLMARSAQEIALARTHTAVDQEEYARRAAAEAIRAVWSADRGTIRVEGAVARPGDFETSAERPLTLRQLVAAAGGAADGATHITIVMPDDMGEQHVVLRSALYPRGPNEVMPPPRAVVIVK